MKKNLTQTRRILTIFYANDFDPKLYIETMEAGPSPEASTQRRLLFGLVFGAMVATTLAWIAFLGWLAQALF